jgi:hypothetical protein
MDADQLCIDMIKELEAVERQGRKDIQTATVWKICMKSRRLYELKCTNEAAGYIMANNSPIRIEVDAAQAKKVNTYCYRRFNRMTSGVPRPGYCNLRYVPDKRFITTGIKGDQDRANMLKKHQAVVSSLKLLRTEEIKNLDTPALINMTEDAYEAHADAMATSTANADGKKTTLRKVLMELTFPLAPKDGQKVTKLFHSVDFATTGPTAGLEVLLTAYDDRIDVASSLVSILPAYIEEFYGQEAVEAWFNHQVEEIKVDFDYDHTCSWTGTWTTSDDKINRALLDEDVGINICLENLSVLDTDKHRRVLDADDASQRTFKMGGGSTQASAAWMMHPPPLERQEVVE